MQNVGLVLYFDGSWNRNSKETCDRKLFAVEDDSNRVITQKIDYDDGLMHAFQVTRSTRKNHSRHYNQHSAAKQPT